MNDIFRRSSTPSRRCVVFSIVSQCLLSTTVNADRARPNRNKLFKFHNVVSQKTCWQKLPARWWFETFFIFTPKLGEDFPFDLRIFFRWVGKNHQPASVHPTQELPRSPRRPSPAPPRAQHRNSVKTGTTKKSLKRLTGFK